MTRRPPGLALALLAACLPADAHDMIAGDLIETFTDREESGRRGNRVWFWGQAIAFAASAIARPSFDGPSGRQIMGRLSTGFRQAARRLVREWRYSLGVALILAVGIGPAAAMIAVVERVLLRPLDYREPERLGLVRLDLGQLKGHPGLSPAESIDLRQSGIFESVETETRRTEVSFGPPDNLISLSSISFTTGMLPMLGVSPILGRSLTEEDFVRTGPSSRVLLDYGTWRTRLGGAPDVVGRTIQINGRSSEVVGVLPDGFELVTGRAVPQRIDVYLPFRLTDFRNAWQFPTLVRLKPGGTFTQAQAGLDTLTARLKSSYPDVYDTALRFTVTPLLEDMTRTTRPALRAAVGAVLLLLVIAFANATALVVARVKTREHDFAIRTALGAGRSALVAEVLIESGLLAAGGAAGGALFATLAVDGVRRMVPQTVPRWSQIAMGWDVLAYACGLALAGLVLSGLIPVWRVARGWTAQRLRSGSVQGGRPEGAFTRLVLVGAQIALTVVLAFTSIQLLRSAELLRRVDLGFDPAVFTLRVPFDFRTFDDNAKRASLYQRLRDRVRQVPGVASVGLVSHIPLSGSTMTDGYAADLSKQTSFDQTVANYQSVTAGYFSALRIPILQGRDFSDVEDALSAKVVIVDETLARTAFPGVETVVGRTLRLGWGLPDSQIVGVVGHVQSIEVGRVVRPQIYAPAGLLSQPAMFLTVRAAGDPMSLQGAIAAAVREVGPGRATSNAALLNDNVLAATSTLRAVTGLVTALAILAGLLSAIGLYMVIAYIVHQRRRATAIRTALGASHGRIVLHHLGTTGLVMSAALPAGIVLSLAVTPMFAGLVYGIGNRDAASLAAALAVAIGASGLGTLMPVSRAGRGDVVQILRGE